jgi:HlyD family secretion protein
MIEGTESMDRIVERPGVARGTKVLIGAALGLLLAVALAWPQIRRWASAEQSVDLARLRLASVTRGDLVREVSAQGRIVAANHPRLFSPAQGIVSLQVKAGEGVRKGQLLARIDSPELATELAQERSRLESLESEHRRTLIDHRQRNLANQQGVELRQVALEAARRELARSEKLAAEGLVNQVELERNRDAVRRAELELRQAEEALGFEREARDFEAEDRARLVVRQSLVVAELERRIRELAVAAPFDGLVATVEVADRDAVAPNAPLLTVVDLSAFEVEVSIPDGYAGEVGPGLAAVVDLGGRTVPGVLASVSPEVTGSQIAGVVQFDGGEPEGLRQNQRVSVRLLLERRQGVLKVARGPFLDSGGGRRIYVLEDGLARLRDIRTGAASVAEVEVVEGLREGERVLLSDTEQFDGARTVLVRR